MIHKIVAEEVRKQLPGVLSEMYVKKIVAESVSSPASQKKQTARRTLTEALEDEEPQEEKIPEPPKSKHRGIYNKESKQQLVKRVFGEEYTSLFDGVEPVPEEGTALSSPTESLPLEQMGFDMERIARLTEAVISGPPSRSSIPETESMVQRRIEQQRKALERPAR